MDFVIKGFLCVCGNDGSGKTSTVAQITKRFNDKQTFIYPFERSTEPELESLKQIKSLLNPKILDKNTLIYTYEAKTPILREILYDSRMCPVYWIILDSPVDVILRRIEKRPKDIFDTRKAIEYYQQRFRELSAFGGIPLIDTSKYESVEHVADEILRLVVSKDYLELFCLRNEILTHDLIDQLNVEERLFQLLDNHKHDLDAVNMNDFDTDGLFDCELLENELNKNADLKKRLIARWLANGQMDMFEGHLVVRRDAVQIEIPFADKYPLLKLVAEGESKRVFKILSHNNYYNGQVVIVLKSTIYSHSKQASSEIENLAQIRAKGTQLFLEMMWRNQMRHSYRSINKLGIVIADYVDTPPIEIVFKKYCEGTDKHSFYDMRNMQSIVLDTGEYVSGPYIRFDWRNPNHVTIKSNTSTTSNPYYYVIERFFGKEKFFDIFLKNSDVCRPFGDKSISPDLLDGVIDVSANRLLAMKVYCTIQYYFDQVGLEIQDGCVMINAAGDTFWSEINQDCMRIKRKNMNESLDKDIWRAGGSSDKIKDKWNVFNQIFTDYFQQHPFVEKELQRYNWYPYQDTVEKILADKRLRVSNTYRALYETIRMPTKQMRRVILTIDLYNHQPVMVKSGMLHEIHSNGDINLAYSKISLFPEILLVDINGVFGEHNNRSAIKQLAVDGLIMTGGGIRSLEDVDDLLSNGITRIVIASNTDKEFIAKIPKDRLIVELTVDENDSILIHGRKTNTGTCVHARIKDLVDLGVEVISVTFHQTEGHLNGIPRQQITKLIQNTPNQIKSIIIAGGISCIEDLTFLWSFNRVVPQLGSAVWKGKINLSDLICEMVNFDREHNLVPAIIQDKYWTVRGLIYLDREALKRTCETRMLHRFSRALNKVVCKGYQSNNIQNVVGFSFDCDNDSLVIRVDSSHPFCHTGDTSCFYSQSLRKLSLPMINDHLISNKEGVSYTAALMQHPGLAYAKLIEELNELSYASTKYQINECSDFLIHFLIYMNSLGIRFDAVLSELSARRSSPKVLIPISNSKSREVDDSKVFIGICSVKDHVQHSPDNFTKDCLGFMIHRETCRGLRLSYTITNQERFQELFGKRKLCLLVARSKDLPVLLCSQAIDAAITYNAVMENIPCAYDTVVETCIPDTSIALIKRKADRIDVSHWSRTKKAVIATEHMTYVHDYLVNIANISEDVFCLDRVSGSSEAFLVNESRRNYILCDAVIETGRTIVQNDLEIWKEILPKGSMKLGLYKNLQCKVIGLHSESKA